MKTDKEKNNILKLVPVNLTNTNSQEHSEERKSLERSPNSQSNKFRSVTIVDEDTFPQKSKEFKALKQPRVENETIEVKESKVIVTKKKDRDINAYTEDRKLDYKTGQDSPPQESKFIKVETYNNSNSSEEVEHPVE